MTRALPKPQHVAVSTPETAGRGTRDDIFMDHGLAAPFPPGSPLTAVSQAFGSSHTSAPNLSNHLNHGIVTHQAAERTLPPSRAQSERLPAAADATSSDPKPPLSPRPPRS